MSSISSVSSNKTVKSSHVSPSHQSKEEKIRSVFNEAFDKLKFTQEERDRINAEVLHSISSSSEEMVNKKKIREPSPKISDSNEELTEEKSASGKDDKASSEEEITIKKKKKEVSSHSGDDDSEADLSETTLRKKQIKDMLDRRFATSHPKAREGFLQTMGRRYGKDWESDPSVSITYIENDSRATVDSWRRNEKHFLKKIEKEKEKKKNKIIIVSSESSSSKEEIRVEKKNKKVNLSSVFSDSSDAQISIKKKSTHSGHNNNSNNSNRINRGTSRDYGNIVSISYRSNSGMNNKVHSSSDSYPFTRSVNRNTDTYLYGLENRHFKKVDDTFTGVTLIGLAAGCSIL